MIDFLLTSAKGFIMALADSVPGVSGGTVAFILGFYDQLIGSLDALFHHKEKRPSAIAFLIKFAIGWVIGMALALLFLASLFASHIHVVSSVFLGFIIFAIPLIIKQEKDALKKWHNFYWVLIGIAVVVALTLLRPSTSGTAIILSALNPALMLYLIFAGVVAVASMLLPGISGSTVLLIFGLYLPIVSGVRDILHFNFSSFFALCLFAIGALIGIVFVPKLINKTLSRFRSATVYAIIGLMLGSLFAIVMAPTTLTEPQAALSLSNFNLIAFIAGGAVMILLEVIRKRASTKTTSTSSLQTPTESV